MANVDIGVCRRTARCAMADNVADTGYWGANLYLGTNYIRDLFNRANGSIAGSSPDEGPSGKTWTTMSGVTNLAISGNQIPTVGGIAGNIIDCGQSSFFISALLISSGAPTTDGTLIIGYRLDSTTSHDANGFSKGWEVGINTGGVSGNWVIGKDGVSQASGGLAKTPLANEVHIVEVWVSGASGTTRTVIWVDGIFIADQSFADTTRSTNTFVGCGTISGTTAFQVDQFFVTDVPSGPGWGYNTGGPNPSASIAYGVVAAGATINPNSLNVQTLHFRWAKIRTNANGAPDGYGAAMVDDNLGVIRAFGTLRTPTADPANANYGYNRVAADEPSLFAATSTGLTSGAARSGNYRIDLQMQRTAAVAYGPFLSENSGTVAAASDLRFGRGYDTATTALSSITSPSGATVNFVYPETLAPVVTLGAQPFRAGVRFTDLLWKQGGTTKKTLTPGADWASAAITLPTQNCDTDLTDTNTFGSGTNVDVVSDYPNANANSNSDRYFKFSSLPSGYTDNSSSILGSSIVTGTSNFSANPHVFPFQDSGHVTSGIAPFDDSSRTLASQLFKRKGPTSVVHAAPFLRVFMFSARQVVIASKSFILATQRHTDSANENSQTISTDGAGKIDWTYTIATTDLAFNRGKKATPDSPAAPPMSVLAANVLPAGEYSALGPYPAYPKNIQTKGNAFAGTKEPSTTTNGVFGVSSEVVFEGLWSGTLVNAALDTNGIPTGPGLREQTLGAGSLKCKLSSQINEGSIKVIDLTEFSPKDIAGRSIDISVSNDKMFGFHCCFNITVGASDSVNTPAALGSQQDIPSGASTKGYATGNNSLDTIAPPTDPGSLSFFHLYADQTGATQQNNVALSSDDPNFNVFIPSGGTGQGTFSTTARIAGSVGWTTDVGNYGGVRQGIAFIAVDLTIAVVVTPEVSTSDPGVTRRFGCKVVRIDPLGSVDDVTPDAGSVIYALFGMDTTGAQTRLQQGVMTAVPTTTADFYVDISIPSGYFALKLRCFAKVNGARTPGGDGAQTQVGFTFDAVDFATGIPFK